MFQGSGLPQFSYEGAQPAVADYFVQVRKNKEYKPSAETIRHVHEVLQLMAVLTKDRRFEEVQIPPRAEGGIAMCEVLDRVEKRGFDLGHHDGFIAGQHDGFISGQNNILALAKRLIASGRIDDLSRASTDSEYLARLLKEEGLQTEAGLQGVAAGRNHRRPASAAPVRLWGPKCPGYGSRTCTSYTNVMATRFPNACAKRSTVDMEVLNVGSSALSTAVRVVCIKAATADLESFCFSISA